jgi:hypothetical protein
MNYKFDELAKDLAQSVTRRGALKNFGLGLAGIALASVGLVNRAEAAGKDCDKFCSNHCKKYPADYTLCYASCLKRCEGGGI